MSTRNTIQKKVIMETVEELNNHPTAEDVYEHIHETYPNMSKATVYRNLRQMSESGRLKRIETANQADHYDHRCHNHYHFQCEKCNNVYDMDMDYMDNLDKKIRPAAGFQVNNHDLIFKGLCPDCSGDRE